MKKEKLFFGAFQEFLQKKFEALTFQNTFCEMLLLQGKNSREGELTCLLHTHLISVVFLMKIRIKENSAF